MIQPTPAMTAMPKNSSENLVRMTRHGNGPSIFLFMHGGVLMFGDAARKDPDTGRFLFTAFAVLGMMGPAMFGFGAAVSTDREQGLLKLKRALPAPPASYLLAKMLMAALFAAIVMTSMIAAAVGLGHHRNAHQQQGRHRDVECDLRADDARLGVILSAAKSPAECRAALALVSPSATGARHNRRAGGWKSSGSRRCPGRCH